jgi:hypothetical protein
MDCPKNWKTRRALGNSPDGQQGYIIELVGFADIILQAFCDSINQISGAGWRFF